jgi:hypothetical protein
VSRGQETEGRGQGSGEECLEIITEPQKT